MMLATMMSGDSSLSIQPVWWGLRTPYVATEFVKNEQQVISVGDRSSKTFEKDLLTQNEYVDFEYAKPGHGTKVRQK